MEKSKKRELRAFVRQFFAERDMDLSVPSEVLYLLNDLNISGLLNVRFHTWAHVLGGDETTMAVYQYDQIGLPVVLEADFSVAYETEEEIISAIECLEVQAAKLAER